MTGIAPGWYKDPAEPTTQRYWDGEGWVGDPLPIDAEPPPGPPPLAAPEPPPQQQPTEAQPAQPRLAQPQPAQQQFPPQQPAQQWPPAHQWPPGQQGPPPGWTPPPGWAGPYPMAAAAPRPHGLPLAASGPRLLARLIDILVLLVLNAAVNGWFIYEYVKEIAPLYRELQQRWQEGNLSTAGLTASDRAGQLQLVIILLTAALWFAYEVPAVANTGQTLGKRLLGLKVMRLENPGRVGFGRSLRRWNTMGLPTLLWMCCGIGFVLQFIDALFIAFDRPMRQALHDKSALTVVVQVEKADSAPPVDSSSPPPDDTSTPGGTP